MIYPTREKQIRLSISEWDESLIIRVLNEKTGEEVHVDIFYPKADEKLKKYSTEIVESIFLQEIEEPLEVRCEKIIKMFKHLNIEVNKISYILPDFQEKIIYKKKPESILNRIFTFFLQ